jgi:hypothetical protein
MWCVQSGFVVDNVSRILNEVGTTPIDAPGPSVATTDALAQALGTLFLSRPNPCAQSSVWSWLAKWWYTSGTRRVQPALRTQLWVTALTLLCALLALGLSWAAPVAALSVGLVVGALHNQRMQHLFVDLPLPGKWAWGTISQVSLS